MRKIWRMDQTAVTADPPGMALDLEGFKRADRLRWQDVALIVGAKDASQAYKWAVGKDFPGAAKLFEIQQRLAEHPSPNAARVTTEAMLRRFA
jgi:hypothetical protein